MSFHFRATDRASLQGKEVTVERVETLLRDSDSSSIPYVRQWVLYSHEGEYAADVIEVEEEFELTEGLVFTLPAE